METTAKNGFVRFLLSIKTKLLASFLIITVVPLIYISYVMLENAREGLFQVIMKNSMGNARKTSIDLNRFIRDQLDLLPVIADQDFADSTRASGLADGLREIDRKNISIEKLYVLDLEGRIVANSTVLAPQYPIDVRHCLDTFRYRDFVFQTHRDPKQRKIVTLCVPVRTSSGEIGHLLVMELNWMRLTNILSENIMGKTTRMYLLDRKNEVITSFPENAVVQDLSLMKSRIDSFSYGVYSVSGKALSTPLISIYLPIVGFGWKVLLVQDQQEVYSLVETFEKNFTAVLLLTVMIAIFIALLISQSIAVPIVKVSRGANQLAAGELDVRIELGSNDEVGQLAKNFNFMADSLSSKIVELNETYEQLKNHARTIEETNEHLDRKVFEMSLLYEVGHKMGEVGLDMDKLLDVIMDKSISAAKAQRGSLMLVNDFDELELRKVRIWDSETRSTVPLEDFQKNITIRSNEGIAGKVMRTGMMHVMNDPVNDPDFKQYEDPDRRINQLVCVPLSINNNVFGVINIANSQEGKDFSSQDTELLLTLANQAALALENAKLFKLAITDGLTDLYLVRHFKNRLEEEVKRSRRYKGIFSIVFMDIDHFKKFNDTYGHQQGDIVLSKCADLLKQCIRLDIDIPARYGGEELIVLLPETDSSGAVIAAERIRTTIENFEFPGQDDPLHVTVSIGISTFPDHAAESLALIQKADTALYFSKENGRNRSTVYHEEMGVVSEK